MKMKITKRTLQRIIREEFNKIQESEKDPYEHALETPLAESDFELDIMNRMKKMDEIAKLQENLQMRVLDLELWATDQGYKRDK